MNEFDSKEQEKYQSRPFYTWMVNFIILGLEHFLELEVFYIGKNGFLY